MKINLENSICWGKHIFWKVVYNNSGIANFDCFFLTKILCDKKNFNVNDTCSQLGWLVTIFYFECCNLLISSFSSCIQAVYIQKPFQCNIYGLRELLIFLFQLVRKRKFSRLFLQFGEFVFVFWDLFECRFDEFTLHVTDRHVQLVDLEIS